jgi:hypothetical protein
VPTEAELGEATRGVWTRRAALTVLTRGRIQTRIDDGSWQVVWPGVYADAGHQLDAEQRGFAAVLASGGEGQPFAGPRPGKRVLKAVASGRTAARIHGLPLVDDDDPATAANEHLLDDVAVRYTAADLTAVQPDRSVRILTRHARVYRAAELTRRPSGLYISSPLRTIVDCAGLLGPDALVCAIDDALHRHLVTAEELARAVAARAWCADVVALRRAVGLADGRAESPAETLARLLLLPVVPGLVPQTRLLGERGRVLARFDLGDPHLRLAVEADGRAAHAGMAARDHRRDRVSDRRGWRTERCVWFELRRQQVELRRRIVQAAAEQAGRHGR